MGTGPTHRSLQSLCGWLRRREPDADGRGASAWLRKNGAARNLFFGATGQGIALFQASGAPFSGDATAALMLIDAGTEVNQEPGVGPDQVQRQSAANTGPSESRPIGAVSDGFSYPATSSVIRLTITPLP